MRFVGVLESMIDTAKQTPLVAPARELLDRHGSSAAESRLDPMTGQWTIYSPQRIGRPEEFVEAAARIDPNLNCPFCLGNEQATPEPVWVGSISADDSSINILKPQKTSVDERDWSVRVVPNKFPAVDPMDSDTENRGSSGLFQRKAIKGGHEVIIESRHHVHSLSDLDLAELRLVFRAYRDRLRYWRKVPGIRYLSVFKNVGVKAGASLSHSHSQLIATDRLPSHISHSLDLMTRHRATTGCCLLTDLIRGELKQQERVIWCGKKLIAYCPFASHLPMLVRVTTLEQVGCLEDLSDKRLQSVSRIVGRVISWLERLRPGTSYNFCLHTRPPAMDDPHDSFHWWIDIFPRMTQMAGFEWSSQCMINPILPEDAAARLRAVAQAEDPRRL